MDKPTAILQIKKACASMASEMMKIHPAAAALGDRPTHEEIIKLLYQLTKDLETIKKRVAAIEKQDDSPEM